MAAVKVPKPSAKERILAAAAKLFYTEGIQNVGIDRIIAESGVAKMSLYNNFKSKDALIAAWLEQRDQEWRSHFVARVNELATEPKDQLLAIFDALKEWSEEPQFRGCAFINSTVELADPNHPGFQVSVRHQDVILALIQSLAIKANLVNSPAIAQQLLILMEGAIVVSMMQGNSTAIAQAKQAATVLIQAHQD